MIIANKYMKGSGTPSYEYDKYVNNSVCNGM